MFCASVNAPTLRTGRPNRRRKSFTGAVRLFSAGWPAGFQSPVGQDEAVHVLQHVKILPVRACGPTQKWAPLRVT